MQKKIKKLKGSQIELRVTLSLDEFAPYLKKETEAALREVHVQGFRKGNAPRDLALQYIDQAKVSEFAIDRAVRESFVANVQENNWHVLAEPKIEVESGDKNGLTYKTEFTVMPEIALPDYKKIAKSVFGRMKEAKVEEKEVQDSLAYLRNARAERVLEERAAATGDTVEIEYDMLTDDPATTLKERKEKITLGGSEIMTGFDEKLFDKKAGEKAEFELTVPKDYYDEKLHGKNVAFSVKVLGVYGKKLPEVNDEFAKSLGNFENADALLTNIREGLAEEKKFVASEKVRVSTLEEIVKKTEVDVPAVLLDDMIAGMEEDARRMVASQGGNWEEYLKDQKKTEAAFREELTPRARERVVSNLVLYEIAQKEQVKPTEKEIIEEVERVGMQFAHQKPDPQKLYNYAASVLQNKKVFERLESFGK